jgi:predicted house-cleaning noncanonical NTP pyrophosphatase (MazG superfamily)
VANHLLLIALSKEFKSANPYSAWAYHKASQTIENLNESIMEICKRKALEKLPGVGKSISKVIEEFLSDAKNERLEKERRGYEHYSMGWGPSFPSGHAGRLFIIATLLWPSRRKMRKFAYFSILLGIVISISRIYVGMHFPLDVIFGAGFGIVAGYVTVLLEKRLVFISSLYLLQNVFKRAFLCNQIHFHAFFRDGFAGQIANSDDFRVF